MNTYKKTILALGITTLACQMCHATAEFNTLQSQLDKAFRALFDPAPDKFAFTTFGRDAQATVKLANFNATIKRIEQFVTTNNSGLILGASATLDQAKKILVTEATNLTTHLGEMKNRLQATNNFAGNGWDSQTEAQRFNIALVNIQDRIKPIRDTLRTKVDDYKSTGQKESYALLVDGLQDIHDAIAILRYNLVIGQWLKKK